MLRFSVLLSTILLAGLVLTSCNKEADDPMSAVEAIAFAEDKRAISPAELPSTILDYMQEHYFETFIAESFLAPTHGYEVHTVEGIREFFSLEGTRLGPGDDEFYQRFSTTRGPCAHPGRLLRPHSLPRAIQNYVATEYPDQRIARAKYIGARGVYLVAINPPIILVFNEQGRFLTSIRCLSLCPDEASEVDVRTLPESITSYVRQHFDNPEILAVFRIRNGQVVVGLFVNGQRVLLIFDAEGHFLYQRG